VRLEILDFIEDRRIIEDALLGPVLRVEAGMERDALARSRVELPNDAIRQALEMATGAALPAFARQAVAQGIGAGYRVKVSARGKKHLGADEVGFALRAGRRQI